MSDWPRELIAGSIKPYLHVWESITSDQTVLQNVQGVRLIFNEEPVQTNFPRQYKFNDDHVEFIEKEIQELLEKDVIIEIQDTQNCFVSNIFLRPKPNNKFRMIIDLSELNKFVTYNHFKMDNLDVATEMLFPDAWMASIDLKEAYYSIPIHEADQKYLVFQWEGRYFKFTCVPFGLCSAPWIFTKTLRPIFAEFHEMGFQGFGYIDDSFIISDSYEECLEAVNYLKNLFSRLGFRVHEEKSVLEPCQEIKFLGYILNSRNMSVTPPQDKKEKVKQSIQKLLWLEKPKIRMVASVLGFLNDVCKGSEYGSAYTKNLEIQKIKFLKWSTKKGFDGKMKLSQPCKDDLCWWLQNIDSASKSVGFPEVRTTLETDASLQGWGACVGELSTGGRWSFQESKLHINVLELLAVKFALRSLCSQNENEAIKILCDNTTSVAYLTHKGGTRSSECNTIAHDIWKWCEQNNITLIVSYLPGVLNIQADHESRNFTEDTEWQLNPDIFKQISRMWGEPDVDLFASKNNCQLDNYVSWGPDPYASAINAFTIPWNVFNLAYIFPPFRLLNKVLQKLQVERAKAVVVAPFWTAQPWFPKLEKASRDSWTIPRRPGNLRRTDKGPQTNQSLQDVSLRLYLI